MSWTPGPLRPPAPNGEVHVWRARLDRGRRPGAAALADAERRRADEIQIEGRRERWVASRGALRQVLARYTGEDPAELSFEVEPGGKPRLGDETGLRFNISHSGEIALVAVTVGRDLGVDVERARPGRPDSYYRDWVRREAIAKCTGAGLGGPPPQEPIWVAELDPGPGWAAAIALRGEGELPRRLYELDRSG